MYGASHFSARSPGIKFFSSLWLLPFFLSPQKSRKKVGAYPTCPTQPDPLPCAPGNLQSLQTPALSSPGEESLHLAGDAAAPSAAHQPVPLTARSCGFVGCLAARASGDTRWHRPAAAPLPAPLSCSTLHSAKGPALPSRGKRGARSERIYPRPSLRCNSGLLPPDPCTLLLPGAGTTLLSSHP